MNIRMIAEEKPDQSAVPVGANLDEVFLYCCKGEDLCED